MKFERNPLKYKAVYIQIKLNTQLTECCALTGELEVCTADACRMPTDMA